MQVQVKWGRRDSAKKYSILNCIKKKIVGEATRESSKIPAKRYRCVSVSAKRLIAAPLLGCRAGRQQY